MGFGDLCVSYLLLALFSNLIAMLAVYMLGGNADLFARLSKSILFDLKYAALSLVLNIVLPCAYLWIKSRVSFTFGTLRLGIRVPNLRCVAAVVAVLLFLLHFVRIFNYNFWADEAFSVLLSRMEFGEMISATAADVHPPLYYALLMVSYRLFGDQGWAYNIVSLVPLAITFVISLTYIWRKFGSTTSLLFMVMSALMDQAITYNLEVRMYSWAALFTLAAFLCLFEIIDNGKGVWYVGFTLSSLAAAYTHYYSFLTAALLYLALIILAIVRRVDIRNTVISSLGAILGYAPWLIVLFGAFSRTSDSYWMTDYPSFTEGVEWIFSTGKSGRAADLMLLVFFAALVLTLLFGTGLLRIEKNRSNTLNISCGTESLAISHHVAWVLSGVFAIVGTMVVGIAVSELLRPMYHVRYLYPAAMIAWLLLAVMLGRCVPGRILAVLLAVFIALQGFSTYRSVVATERSQTKLQNETLPALRQIEAGDTIYTNNFHLSFSTLECYFPDTEVLAMDGVGHPQQSDGVNDWLILSGNGVETYSEWLLDSGFEAQEICLDGRISKYPIDAYRLVPLEKGVAE